MKNRLGLVALVLWLASAAALATTFIRGNTAPAPDGRVAILMSAGERDFVLAEMRGLLQGLREISAALADGDGARAGKVAKALGMAEAHDRAPALLAKLPLDFKRQAIGLHGGFDDFADVAAKGEIPARLQLRLIDQMDRCVACHAGFRIESGK